MSFVSVIASKRMREDSGPPSHHIFKALERLAPAIHSFRLIAHRNALLEALATTPFPFLSHSPISCKFIKLWFGAPCACEEQLHRSL